MKFLKLIEAEATTPTTDYQVANKKYVDDSLGSNTSTPYSQSFTATLNQTNFTLAHTPSAAWIWVNGALQHSSTWSISTNDIILSTSLLAGDSVDVYYLNAIAVGTVGMLSLVEDTTPQLGGNLDLNTFNVGDATPSDLTNLHNVTASYSELNILDGATLSTSELNILDGVTATATELNILDGVTATTTELNYVDGVTSAIQTQFSSKLTVSGTVLLTVSSTAPGGTPSNNDLWVDIS